MRLKRSRTIAEYVIRKFLEENHIDTNWFHLEMNGNEAVLTD